MSSAKFITIEGIEGAGKSTAITFVQQYLKNMGLAVTLTREPGGTDIAEEIRRVLLHRVNQERMRADTELLLMFASRAQHLHHCILPALKQGRYVLSDRFVDASYAYQGGGRHVNVELIKQLEKYIVGSVKPDLTLLLDVPAELGLTRAASRNQGKDRIESETLEFFVRVREAYLSLAKSQSNRIHVIDASQTLGKVQEQITRTLDVFFERNK